MTTVLPLHRPPHIFRLLLTSASLSHHPPIPLHPLSQAKRVLMLPWPRTSTLHPFNLTQDSSICLHLLAPPID